MVEVLKRTAERLGGDFYNRDYEHQFMERELLFIGAGKNGCMGGRRNVNMCQDAGVDPEVGGLRLLISVSSFLSHRYVRPSTFAARLLFPPYSATARRVMVHSR